jgi:hypothetical protein
MIILTVCDVVPLQSFYGLQDFLHVTRYFNAAPLADKLAVGANEEGRALDAPDFLAIHVLHLHDAELPAQRLVRVGEELERESHLGLEVLMRLQAVARNADHYRAQFRKLFVQVPELGAFDRAPGSVVLGIEIQNDGVALLRRKLELAARTRRREVDNFFAGHVFLRGC